MKTIIYIMGIIVLGAFPAYSQAPAWSVNENDFEYTMSLVSFLSIDGDVLDSENDMVAAFVNGECRGVTHLVQAPVNGRFYGYLTVFSNTSGEVIDFKVYKASTGEVRNIKGNSVFEINAHYGNLFQAFSIADPQLSAAADFMDFSFDGITSVDTQVGDGAIEVTIYDDNDVMNLTPVFEVSDGADVFLGTTLQVSGGQAMSFNSPIVYSVRSENEAVLKDWKVTVKLVEDVVASGTATFYKKDAVCHTNGAIKVMFSVDNVPVSLMSNGTVYATGVIEDGEVVFDDLPEGSYNVKVGSYDKPIAISMNN